MLAALVPPGVVTVIFPVVPVPGGVAVREVAVGVPVIVPATPLKVTAVAPNKLVPVIVTGEPNVGVKLVTVGAGCVTVKFEDDTTDPAGVVTVIGPEVAPVGTLAVKDKPVVATVGAAAATPLNFTPVAPNRFVPVIVTVAPTKPEVGVNGAVAENVAGK